MIASAVLWTVATAAEFLETGLALARIIGLPVSSWRAGDPTRSLYKFVAEVLAERDIDAAEYVKSGFLSTAEGDWKTVNAKEVYGIDREAATFAQSTVSLLNVGGGYYTPDAGDVSFKSTLTGKTYHTVNAFSLLGVGTTASVLVEADEAGSASSAGVDEIDAFVTPLLEVTITGSTAANATDEQDEASLETQCMSTLGALSPNGPPDAYEYVVRNHTLTGEQSITRAASTYDSSTGDVTVYVAGDAGAVPGASVTLAQTAVETWATPLCVTPTVVNGSNTAVAVTAVVTGDDIPAGLQASFSTAYASFLKSTRVSTTERPTKITRSAISRILQTLAEAGGGSNVSVALAVPAADVTLGAGAVATAGAVSVT